MSIDFSYFSIFQIPNSRLGLLAAASTDEEITRLCSDYSLVDNE